MVVVGPRSEEATVTTGFLSGAAETAGRWPDEEETVSALDVGLLRMIATFSFAGAGGGGIGIGTRRGPSDAKLCGPEVARVGLMPDAIGRRWGADVVVRETVAWERKGGTGPLTSWAEPGRVAVGFPPFSAWDSEAVLDAGTDLTGI